MMFPSARPAPVPPPPPSRARTLRSIFKPIDDNRDVVLDAAIEFKSSVSLTTWPSTRARRSRAEHVLEQVLVLSFLAADHRREDEKARPLGQGQNAGEDLFARLGGDRPAAIGAMSLADAGVKDAQVIVDLGDRADRGARILAGRLLLNADGWRQASQIIDIGLLQLAEELAGVATTAIRHSGAVPRRRGCRTPGRFAGTTDAGEEDQLIARQLEIRRFGDCVRGRRG